MMKKKKQRCEFCPKLVGAQGRRKHLQFAHPDEYARMQANNGVAGLQERQDVESPTLGSLDQVLGAIKIQRMRVAEKIAQLGDLESQDQSLANEEHILEVAIKSLSLSPALGTRETPEEHPPVRRANQGRTHAAGAHGQAE